MPKKFSYYVTGNTADGFVNYISSNVEHMKVIQLTHPSHTVKTTVLKKLINHYDTDYDIEVICSAISQKFIEGFIIRELSIAVITNNLRTSELNVTQEINLGDLFEQFVYYGEEHNQINELIHLAYDYFKKGLTIHDDLEKIYINEMDFPQADDLADRFIEKLLHHVSNREHDPHIFRRLFGTNTIEGSVNIVPHIIQTVSKRYYIKGRAGTGKSVFMNKVADACLEKGFDIELYHCSFDPSSIDMVLVRELDFCMFDSTDPHEFSPENEDDVVIDLYEETVTPGTDEKYANDIKHVTQAYKSYMKKGVSSLKEAGSFLQNIELKYMRYIDDNEIKRGVNHILTKIS